MTSIKRKALSLAHTVIFSKRSFTETHEALMFALPYHDRLRLPERLKAAADPSSKRAILASLPSLAILGPPQDFGGLAAILGGRGGRTVQFDIGNPFIAGQLACKNPSAALYTPVRVILVETPDGKAVFEFDSPKSSIAQLEDGDMNEIATKLDEEVVKALSSAAGLKEGGDAVSEASLKGSSKTSRSSRL
jgi:hypothetical protein